MSTIHIENLTKRFGDLKAVDNVNLSVAAGEVVCLLGPSGCGKTTTLRMVAGLEEATSGDISLDGRRVNNLTPAQRDIAMVFQFYALYPSLTVSENLAYPLHAQKLDAAAIAERVSRVADQLALHGVLGRRPGHLAEGEKQRVAVGRAIVRDPNCFLFDEPLSRLDIELRQSMRTKIKEVLSGLSKATVIVTHDQIEALTMADRVAVMRDGRIEQVASPHDIFTAPVNTFVAGFIGTPGMNLMETVLRGSENGRATLTFGETTWTVAGLPEAAQQAQGSACTLGVRPRAFEIAPESGEDTLPAEVDLIEPMGAETLLHLLHGSQALRVVVPRESPARTGERLHLRCRPGQAFLFNEEGNRVLP